MACEICKAISQILIGLFVFICFMSSNSATTTQSPAVQTPDAVTNTTTTIISTTNSTQSVYNGSDVKPSPLPGNQTLGSNGTAANTTENKLQENITTPGLVSSNVTTSSSTSVPTVSSTFPVILPSPSSGNNDTNTTTSSATSTGVAPNTTTMILTPDISTTTVTSTVTEVSKTTMVTPLIMPTNSSSNSTDFASTSTLSAAGSVSTITKVAPTSSSTTVAPASIATKAASSSTSLTSKSQTTSKQTTELPEKTGTTIPRTTETTKASNTNGQSNSRKQCKETPFGSIGLFVFIALALLCIILLLVLVFLLVKFKRKKKESQLPTEETAAPKLKMLEIKDTPVKTYSNAAGPQDGLQTYSLDYEKYVQQKKEEHKRKVANTSSTDANGPAVSSFLIGKKPLVMRTPSDLSSSSNQDPNSPRSPSGINKPGSQPGTPAEKKPLMNDEEPVVFNFTKTPGESLAARRSSKPDTDEKRRGSSSSTKPTKGLELSPDNFTLDL